MLEKYLLDNIPISAAMGVRVVIASLNKVVLAAPFANNINHKKTVFGGSLHAMATLSCWSLLHLNLATLCPQGTQIVIAHSSVEYLHPVTSDFQAECNMPDSSEWERFVKILQKKGKARINLKAAIYESDCLCVDFNGTFVALRSIGYS